MNKFLARFIITFATLIIASIIAKYFNFSIVDSVCIGFISSIFNDIVIDVAGVRNE